MKLKLEMVKLPSDEIVCRMIVVADDVITLLFSLILNFSSLLLVPLLDEDEEDGDEEDGDEEDKDEEDKDEEDEDGKVCR